MTLQDVLNAHKQIFKKSCPVSAMELVAKLHGKMEVQKFTFQEKYKEDAVGFSKLFELDNLGLKTATQSMSLKDAWALCESENKAGRFPLVSLPTEYRVGIMSGEKRLAEDSNHIFITAFDPIQGLVLVGHAFGATTPIVVPKVSEIEQRILDFDPSFQVNLVTYTL